MKLNLYPPQQEENIYIRRQAQAWRRSGLITEEQLSAINGYADPQLRQTNLFFRILFFVFTLLCTGAVVGLFVWLLDFKDTSFVAVMLILFGAAFYMAAEYLAGKYLLYRHGVEEALVIVAMVLFCAGCGILLFENHVTLIQVKTVMPALFAMTAYWIYLRFGLLYAAAISIVALGVIPFQFNLSPATERLMLFFVLCVIFVFSLHVDQPDIEDFRKDKYAKMQACLLMAIYLTVNLEILGLVGLIMMNTHVVHLNPKLFPPSIYWSSYVLTFLIPAAAVYWGIRSRKRLIINVGIVLACVTLATNKSYLGWTRYAWDPAILGIVLVGLSLFITRWLNSGPDQKRFGFTARDILKPEEGGITPADVAAALTPGVIDAQQPQAGTQDQYFKGGSSGGGGVEGEF
ncbi:MAG: hypothetical protein ABFD75_04790 [Smithella sp.]